jgi:glycosyltransferase involved in cell wall biosynthesis
MCERPVFINGRFLAQPLTGVQRYASEVLKALDSWIEREPGAFRAHVPIEILVPPEARQSLELRHIAIRKVGHLHGNLWEQLSLPWHARSGLLVGLCNINPLLHPRQVVVFHDASVFAVPQAYSLAFRLKYQLVFKVLGRTARRVATVSHFSRAEIGRYCALRPEKLIVVPEGSEHILAVAADEGVFEKHAIGERPFVLAVSSHSPHKNLGGLVQAAGLMADAGLDFVLAGGTFGSVFRTSPAELPPHVRAIGYVSDGELRALYQRAACFVYPTFYEGFGLPPLEAMRAGCPVVVARAASLPEVCGQAALYVDPHRPDQIAAQIARACQPAQRAALQAAGWQHADSFSWDRAARAIWQVIDGSLAEMQ